jgi:hypothetical protein
MHELLQAYSQMSFMLLASSMLAILSLRIVTGSASDQIKLIREFTSLAETTSRNCIHARHVAATWELQALEQGQPVQPAKVVPLFIQRPSGLHFIDDSDRLIRMVAAVTRDSSDMRVAGLRRRLKA